MKTTLKKPVAIVGYSGHAYVIIDILLSAGRLVTAYCDSEEKAFNPYHLDYLGEESDVINKLKRLIFRKTLLSALLSWMKMFLKFLLMNANQFYCEFKNLL